MGIWRANVPLVLCFKTPFHEDHIRSINHVLDNMAVSGEGRDEWPDKVIAKGLLPLHSRAWNFRHHIISVKRQERSSSVPSHARKYSYMNDRASDTDQDALGAAIGILQWVLSYTHKRRCLTLIQPSGWSNCRKLLRQ